MVINGGARGGAGDLAAHLQRTDTNERVFVLEMRGVAADDLDGALSDMEAIASGARSKRPLYHANINTGPQELLTAAQKHHAVDRLEADLGFTGQPRVVVEHEKHGRAHLHVVWLRIDLDTMKAIPDSHNFRKHEQCARDLELEFEHQRVQGAHIGREDGDDRPPRAATYAEYMQAARSGRTPQETKAQLRELWQSADTGRAFSAALNEAGWILARGDKRGFVALDAASEVHAVNKAITELSAAGVRGRLADLDVDALPNVDEARARQRARGDLELDATTTTAAPQLTTERMAADEQRDARWRELHSGTNDDISLALHRLQRTDRAAAATIITPEVQRVRHPDSEAVRFIAELAAQAAPSFDQVNAHQAPPAAPQRQQEAAQPTPAPTAPPEPERRQGSDFVLVPDPVAPTPRDAVADRSAWAALMRDIDPPAAPQRQQEAAQPTPAPTAPPKPERPQGPDSGLPVKIEDAPRHWLVKWVQAGREKLENLAHRLEAVLQRFRQVSEPFHDAAGDRQADRRGERDPATPADRRQSVADRLVEEGRRLAAEELKASLKRPLQQDRSHEL